MTNLENLLAMLHRHNVYIQKPDMDPEDGLDGPDESGVRWAWVGRNSSHDFYLGVDAEDRLYSKNFGEEYDREGYEKALLEVGDTGVNPDDFLSIDFSVPKQIPLGFDGVGYIGHY